MNKKIISYLMIFSTLSLFSLGFSSWQIVTKDESISPSIDGVIADDIFHISDVGVSVDYEKYPVESFSIYTEDGNKALYSSDILFTFIVQKDVIEDYPCDYIKAYYLQVDMYYDYNSNSTDKIDIFTSEDLIQQPSYASIYLKNNSSAKFETEILKNDKYLVEYKDNSNSTYYRYSITTCIPINSSDESSINNIVKRDNYSNSVPVIVKYSFFNPTNYFIDNLDILKNIQIKFILSLKEKN